MKIAVVGSGISGLTLAHYLGKKHQITLFEKDKRVGFRISLVTSDRAEFSAWHVTVQRGIIGRLKPI